MSRIPAILFALALAPTALAVPMSFSHQGRLMDALGNPIDVPTDVTFRIYDTPSGGTPVWEETHTALPFDNGHFSAVLGATSAMDGDDFNGDTLYLALQVGTGAELPTRVDMISVPYAVRAGVAGDIDAGLVIDAAEIQVNGTTVIDSSGNIDGAAITGGTDNDTLAGLGCSTDEIARHDGSAWVCVDDNDHGHVPADTTGVFDITQLPVGTGATNVAVGDHVHSSLVTLDSLSCNDGDSPAWDAGAGSWGCAAPPVMGGGHLLASFELDETSGSSFSDGAGGNDAATAGSGLAVGSGGHAGNAVTFGGNGGLLVDTGNTIADSPQVWAEAWIRPAAPLTGTQVIGEKQGAWELTQEDDTVVFTVHAANADCSVTSLDLLTVGTWTHVAGWYDGLTATVSVDGAVLAASCAEGPVSPTAGDPLSIGARVASGGGISDAYDGRIDEFRVRPTAPLTQLSVQNQGYRFYRISSPTWTNGYMILCNVSMWEGTGPDLIDQSSGNTYSIDTTTWGNVNQTADQAGGGTSTSLCVQTDGNNNHWWKVEFPAPHAVSSFGVTGWSSSHRPTGTWFLHGSNDDSNWDLVWSGTGHWPTTGSSYPVPDVIVIP